VNAFDAFNEQCFSDAEFMFGVTSWTMDGKAYNGILNEFEGDHDLEMDGMMIGVNATLVCGKAQFRMITKPVHKTMQNKTVTIDGINYTVTRATVDSASVTLGLRIAR
jgi:hypothetical protein